jgi:hypothetical protein
LSTVWSSPDGFVSLQVGSDVCFYVTTSPEWPFPNGIAKANAAEAKCGSIGQPLAKVANDNEKNALLNFMRK